MPLSGLIISSLLVAFSIIWMISTRAKSQHPLGTAVQKLAYVPSSVWLFIAISAFTIPVLEYWFRASSHGNALAGFLPWADAVEYFFCSETYLIGAPNAADCGKRPFYTAFFTDLLWLTNNQLQLALLIQALIVGSGIMLFVREIARYLSGPAALSAYAALYLFSAMLCAGLVMTENVGMLLGVLGMAFLCRCAHRHSMMDFLFGISLIACGLSARPGPMFVLPAVIGWYFLHGEGDFRKRAIVAVLGIIVSVCAFGLSASPGLLAGGTFGSTHSNFSYSLYGLIVGGKSWTQVTIDHPEFFNQGDGGLTVTNRVYAAAFESLLNKPHLFVLGYIKGIAHYLDDLFRYATGFKPLRAALIIVWIMGLWSALTKWREPHSALMLFLQAGLIVSAPFLSIDGQNRVFASTVAIDALFVALGMVWISGKIGSINSMDKNESTVQSPSAPGLAVFGIGTLLLPVALFAIIRPLEQHPGYKPHICENGLEAVVLQPGKSTLVLPLVKPGMETLYPLGVRADHFGSRFHSWVHHKNELKLPPGNKLVQGYRLDSGSVGHVSLFSWDGEMPPSGQLVGFCVKKPEPGGYFGTAKTIVTVDDTGSLRSGKPQ